MDPHYTCSAVRRRLTGIAAALCAACTVLLCACSQEDDSAAGKFLKAKEKAEKGNAPSQTSVGVAYLNGEGVAQDDVEAAKWFRRGAEQNYALAQDFLGYCYDGGKGVKKDYVEAVKWYRKAAEQDYATAQSNLGHCYKFGNGVSADYPEAYAWYSLAANSGQLLADFSAQVRNELAEKMSPQQITAGEQRTKELRAQIDAKLKNGGK